MNNKNCYLLNHNINNKVYDFVIDIEESLKIDL